jgi:hypothetical protein
MKIPLIEKVSAVKTEVLSMMTNCSPQIYKDLGARYPFFVSFHFASAGSPGYGYKLPAIFLPDLPDRSLLEKVSRHACKMSLSCGKF